MEKFDLCKCEVCGNIVEALVVGDGVLVCCGQDMIVLQSNNEESFKMTHVPVVKEADGVRFVQVGEALHIMNNEHQIMFVEIISKDKMCKRTKFFNPGDEAKMSVCAKFDEANFDIREYCNIHRLWQKEG
ncbi:MAG: desulfoferrodoxin family protein [Candidatus Gastranaerophilales bacterium]